MTDQGQINLILVGCEGQMGQAVASIAARESSCVLAGQIDRKHRHLPEQGGDFVVVDFSSESGVREAISISYDYRAPLLTGTTGLSQETHEMLRELAGQVPVCVASNTSLGIAVMRELVGVACRVFGVDGQWTVQLLEKHHTKKKDAPSGTALELVSICSDGGFELSPDEVRSIREGTIVGEHEIRFSSREETLTVRHEAHDRGLFARGAILLARSLHGRSPGLFDVKTLLDPQNG